MISLYRVLIQIISYEVGLIFLFLLPNLILNSFNFYFYWNYNNKLFLFSFIIIFRLVLVSLREINRIPFEFLERETELVSGFNVEYISSLFSFIFLIEYGFFLSIIIIINFFFLFHYLNILFLFILIIWSRSFIPRYRYDKILYYFWKDIIIIIFFLYIFTSVF